MSDARAVNPDPAEARRQDEEREALREYIELLTGVPQERAEPIGNDLARCRPEVAEQEMG